jgi:hypothetical protein
MKLAVIMSTAVLSLTLGIAAPLYAQDQHDQQEDQKDKPVEKKAQPEKPAKEGDKNAREEKNTKPEENNARQEQQRAPEAKPGEQQRASGNRIPDDRYKANFGQAHTFRVNQGDYNNHRFQYGGYSFGFVGVWPGNWLYTQNVYVVDIGGVYYLCNPMYPGVNVELSVTL